MRAGRFMCVPRAPQTPASVPPGHWPAVRVFADLVFDLGICLARASRPKQAKLPGRAGHVTLTDVPWRECLSRCGQCCPGGLAGSTLTGLCPGQLHAADLGNFSCRP